MGVQITEIDLTIPSSDDVKPKRRVRVTNSTLPYNALENSAALESIFKKSVRPSFVRLAGTSEDIFNSNTGKGCDMELSTAFDTIWAAAYGKSLPVSADDKKIYIQAVRSFWFHVLFNQC